MSLTLTFISAALLAQLPMRYKIKSRCRVTDQAVPQPLGDSWTCSGSQTCCTLMY